MFGEVVFTFVVALAGGLTAGAWAAGEVCREKHAAVAVPEDRSSGSGISGRLRVEGGWVVRAGERLVFVPDRTEPQEF